MAAFNAEYINPFLMASSRILKDMCMVDVKIGKPYVNNNEFKENSVVIIIGITGEFKGQVMITFDHRVACDIASKMIMMPIVTMDDLATSAICELGNMILGNSATIFSTKGISIDITPPTVCTGSMAFNTSFTTNICVPLEYEGDKTIEINVALKGD